MRVAVLGGTGTIGRLLVAELAERGVDVRACSRSSGVDVITGAGLTDALDGVDIVVDATNCLSLSTQKTKRFFTTAASNVAYAARVKGVGRIVCISIINASDQRLHKYYGYYAGKTAQEATYRASGLPVEIVRSTQWFELADVMLSMLRVGSAAFVPKMLCQPIAARSVARFIADNVLATNWGPEAEIAGPEVMDLADVAKQRAISTAPSLNVVGIPFPGPIGSGGLLPPEGTTQDSTTITEWLGRR